MTNMTLLTHIQEREKKFDDEMMRIARLADKGNGTEVGERLIVLKKMYISLKNELIQGIIKMIDVKKRDDKDCRDCAIDAGCGCKSFDFNEGLTLIQDELNKLIK